MQHTTMQKAQHKYWHSRGYLPHCDTPGLLQAVTFRLADSLPAEALLPLQQASINDVEKRKRIEALLDAGYGACWLKQSEIAGIVENACYMAMDKAIACWRGV